MRPVRVLDVDAFTKLTERTWSPSDLCVIEDKLAAGYVFRDNVDLPDGLGIEKSATHKRRRNGTVCLSGGLFSCITALAAFYLVATNDIVMLQMVLVLVSMFSIYPALIGMVWFRDTVFKRDSLESCVIQTPLEAGADGDLLSRARRAADRIRTSNSLEQGLVDTRDVTELVGIELAYQTRRYLTAQPLHHAALSADDASVAKTESVLSQSRLEASERMASLERLERRCLSLDAERRLTLAGGADHVALELLSNGADSANAHAHLDAAGLHPAAVARSLDTTCA